MFPSVLDCSFSWYRCKNACCIRRNCKRCKMPSTTRSVLSGSTCSFDKRYTCRHFIWKRCSESHLVHLGVRCLVNISAYSERRRRCPRWQMSSPSMWHLTFVFGGGRLWRLPWQQPANDVSRLHKRRRLQGAYRDAVPGATETLSTLRSNLADQYLPGEGGRRGASDWGEAAHWNTVWQLKGWRGVCVCVCVCVCGTDRWRCRMSHMSDFLFFNRLLRRRRETLSAAQTETTVKSVSTNELVPTAAPSLHIKHTEYV